MAFIDDLIKAGNTFNEGLKQYGVTNQITAANQQVADLTDQLAQEAISQNDYRKKARAVANDLAMKLTALQADPNQVNQAFAALAPKTYASSAEARMQGDEAFAAEMDKYELENKKKLLKATSEDEINKYWSTTGRLELMKAGMKPEKGVYFSDLELQDPNMDEKMARTNAGKLTDVRTKTGETLAAMQDYRNFVNEFGTFGIGQEGAKLKSKREFLKLKMKELMNLGVLQKIDDDKLDETIGPTGIFTRNSTALSTLDELIAGTKLGVTNAIKNYGFVPKTEKALMQREGLAPVTEQSGIINPNGKKSVISITNPNIKPIGK